MRWFYLASLRGRYSGSQETALDEDLKALSTKEPIAGLMKVLGPIGDVTAEEFDDAGARNPLFAMTYAAARKRGAKDWFTGVTLATDVVGKEHDIQIHHVFPKALLKKAGVSRKDRDEIANLAFLAARPGVVKDAHLERLGSLRDGSADPAEADDAERRAADLAAEKVRVGPAAFPAAVPYGAVAGYDPPPDRKQECEGEIGGCSGNSSLIET